MLSRRRSAPPFRPAVFAAAGWTATFVDLGKSPLCESFLDGRPARRGREPSIRSTSASARSACSSSSRPTSGGGDLPGLRLLLVVLGLAGSSTRGRYTEQMASGSGSATDSLVVELASNDGYLLQHFVAHGIPALGDRSRRERRRGRRAARRRDIVDFFDSRLARRLVDEGRRADLIAANNVLAQVPDAERLRRGDRDRARAARGGDDRGAASRPADRGAAVRHDLPRALLVLLADDARRLFADHGLEVFDVEELPSHGGSLRVVRKRQATTRAPSTAVARVLDGEAARRATRASRGTRASPRASTGSSGSCSSS